MNKQDVTMGVWRSKLVVFLVGVALPILSLQPVNADDTKIFYVGEPLTPKVMMILDTSLSMSKHVSNGESRLTKMKKAMRTFINDAEGIEVGLMRMNQISGAVIYPISDLTSSVTETIGKINRPITENQNNAYEESGGGVVIDTTSNLSMLKLKNSRKIGLRFNNIVINKNTIINNAYLEFFPKNKCKKVAFDASGKEYNKTVACPELNLTVRGESTLNTAGFSSAINNISGRNTTIDSKSLTISNWNGAISSGVISVTELTPIIQEIVKRDDWSNGQDLSLIIDTSSASQALNDAKIVNDIGIANAISRYSPTLFIEFAPYERTITTKAKMLEELDNQKLTYHTPIVPVLFEATKYLQGANIESTYTSKLTTTRSATERTHQDPIHERVPYPTSYKNGRVDWPVGCNIGNLNSVKCKGVAIIPKLATPQLGPQYISPLTDTCTDNEASIILLTDGAAHHQSNSFDDGKWWKKMTQEIATLVKPDIEGAACTTNTGNNGNPKTCGEELATKLASGIEVNGITDLQTVSLHTIGFNNNDPWLTTLATAGKGSYNTATSSSDLVTVFKNIQSEILKGVTTFSNTSASINTANRLSHNDTLFFALFQPNERESWPGNLKRYRLGSNGNIYDYSGADHNGVVATDPATGKFLDTAISWWGAEADGANVASGGAVGRLSALTSRNIYINAVDSSNVLTLLANTDEIKRKFSESDFDVTASSEKGELIAWMLANKTIADPLHSSPIEVNYSNGSVIFFGDNQGYIHAIDSATGDELYAFMPKELLKNQIKIKTNIESRNHLYGMDGEIVKWQKSATKTYIYSGMRRGGSSYYALDVSNKTTPILKWVISPSTSGFGDLGQTWSKPIKTKVKVGSTLRDVLIFGGGYDPQQDNVSTQTQDTKGGAIYIVDAETGELIASKTGLGYSIPSDIKGIDIDGDKAADQLYVGDMGGQVWRFDLTEKSASQLINASVIAEIADNTPSGNRRFYHAPDVSIIDGTGNSMLAVAVGSGYRAHPNDGEIVDEFYMFKQPLDNSGANTASIKRTDLYDATANLIGEAATIESKAREVSNLNDKQGWRLTLERKGEKVLASSLTFDSAIWFTTFQPTLGVNNCVNQRGTSRLYRVNVADATPNYKHVLPKLLDTGDLDESQRCDNVSCDTGDRGKTLHNAALAPRPSLLNIEDKKIICVGTECYPAAKTKTTTMYWFDTQ